MEYHNLRNAVLGTILSLYLTGCGDQRPATYKEQDKSCSEGLAMLNREEIARARSIKGSFSRLSITCDSKADEARLAARDRQNALEEKAIHEARARRDAERVRKANAAAYGRRRR